MNALQKAHRVAKSVSQYEDENRTASDSCDRAVARLTAWSLLALAESQRDAADALKVIESRS